MKKYLDDVNEAIKEGLNKRFPNSTLGHAKVLTKQIINHAGKKIYILSSSFNQEFYKSIQSEIEDFLKKQNSVLHLIVADGSNGLINILKNKYSNFHVEYISKEDLPKDPSSQEYINYIVNDKNAFRYEYNDSNIDIGIVEAIANFNNKSEASALISFFIELQKKSHQLAS